MNARKLWERLATGGRNIRFDDFVKVIEAFGGFDTGARPGVIGYTPIRAYRGH